MQELQEYVMKNAVRGDCVCGKCADAVKNPKQPQGHTADMIFFKVSAGPDANADRLRELIKANVRGSFCDVDLFDGEEHSYLEVGGWIGDQGAALMLMGLGSILGLWKLLTPYTVLGSKLPKEVAMQAAGAGYVSIKAGG